jgi:hypothetical protein
MMDDHSGLGVLFRPEILRGTVRGSAAGVFFPRVSSLLLLFVYVSSLVLLFAHALGATGVRHPARSDA